MTQLHSAISRFFRKIRKRSFPQNPEPKIQPKREKQTLPGKDEYLAFFAHQGFSANRESLALENWLDELIGEREYRKAHDAIVNNHKQLHDGRSNFMTEWFDAKPVASLIFDLSLACPDEAGTTAFLDVFAKSNNPYRPSLVARAQWEILKGRYQQAIDLFNLAESKHNVDPYIHHAVLRCTLALNGGSFLTNPFADRFCDRPFAQAYLQHKGKLTNCCDAWLPYSLGNSEKTSVADLWVGKKANEIRRSVVDGDYQYCSPRKCQFLRTNTLPKTKYLLTNKETPTLAALMEKHKKRLLSDLVLSHDSSCNLSCPMCRNELIMAKGDDVRRLNQLEPGILDLIAKSESVFISGSGEPLASRHFRNILAALNTPACPIPPNFLLKLLTNGLLLTRAYWEEHPNLHGIRKIMVLSADAASAEVYSKVRRGGDFNTLMKNFELFDELRETGELEELRLHFTIQEDNCHEIESYVDLMAGHKVDSILFLPLQPRVHYQRETFIAQDACHPNHPKFPVVKRQLEKLWETRPPHVQFASTVFTLIGKSVHERYDPTMVS